MMFYALATSVCLAVLFLLLAGASLLGGALRGLVPGMLRSLAPVTAARVLFTIRVLPLFLAAGLTLGLALPAFVKFEPRSTHEAMSAKLMLLSLAGAAMLIVMVVRGFRVLQATVRTERRWRAGSQAYWVNAAGHRYLLHFVDGSPGLLAVTGFLRPRFFVAKEVAQTLSWDELSAALAHEIAHVSFYDNLKQLLLKITRPPRWLGGNIDEIWTNVSEVAADEAALAAGASALDLAAALVKTGSLQRGCAAGEQMAVSHLLPRRTGSAMEMRVVRLQRVLRGELTDHMIKPASKRWRTIGAILFPLAIYVLAISTLLPAVHEALELLVR